jgi:hypothetical protein
LAIEDRIQQSCPTLRLAFPIDFQLGEIGRIEANLDALAGQMGRGLKETMAQHESGIAAHQAIHAMKERAAQIGGRRELAERSISRCQRSSGVVAKELCSVR